MRIIYLLLFILSYTAVGFAQVESVDSSLVEVYYDEDGVNIFKDSRLDILEKRPALLAKLEAEESRADKSVSNKEKDVPLYKPIISADGKKKVMGSIYTSKGFRVIIFNGPDRNAAMDAKVKFMGMFPNTPSYVSYNSPSYKIKVGNFENMNDAAKFLRKVSKVFPASFIVPDVVMIKNINVTNQ
jgi:Sporulation related domain.